MAVTVVPMGGLGNQLFQYAFGLAVSARHQTPLEIDFSWYERTSRRGESLTQVFDGLQQSSERIGKRRLRALWSFGMRYPRTVEALKPKVFLDRQKGYDASALESPGKDMFLGYFQSWRYFATEESQLRAELTAGTPRALRGILEGTLEPVEAVAVHIREGDYSTRQARRYHGQLTMDYYKRAVQLATNEIGSSQVRVFSESSSAVRRLQAALGPHLYVSSAADNSLMSPLHVLQGMASYRALVCANSTFSWWSAFLGRHHMSNVTIPQKWSLVRNVDPNNFALPGWIVLA